MFKFLAAKKDSSSKPRDQAVNCGDQATLRWQRILCVSLCPGSLQTWWIVFLLCAPGFSLRKLRSTNGFRRLVARVKGANILWVLSPVWILDFLDMYGPVTSHRSVSCLETLCH